MRKTYRTRESESKRMKERKRERERERAKERDSVETEGKTIDTISHHLRVLKFVVNVPGPVNVCIVYPGLVVTVPPVAA